MPQRPAASMAFRFLDGFFVIVHAADNPSAAEWTAFCAQVERHREHTDGVVVFTDGGTPSSTQRSELRDAIERDAAPTAVLTTSALVRGAITSLNWFFPSSLSAFAPDDLSQALELLRSRSNATLPTDVLLETLRALAAELGQPLPFESAFAKLMRQRRASGY